MPNLEAAIRSAGFLEDGKCEPHQYRVGAKRLRAYQRKLLRNARALRRCHDFDELRGLLFSLRVRGVGVVTVYDTAVRIGAYLGLAPEKVYLHAGVLEGARRFGLDTSHGCILRQDLPVPLRRLKPSDVENFLCIYKNGRLRKAGCSKGGSRGCSRPPRSC